MRLIVKTTLLYLALALLVFGLGGIGIYQGVKHEVQRETDYALLYDLQRIVQALERGHPDSALNTDKIFIQRVESYQPADTLPVFSDTIALHAQLRRPELHRQVSVVKTIGEHAYRIQIREVFIEESDVLEGVVKIISRLFLVLSIVFILSSFLLSRWLLRPLHLLLDRLAHFSLKDDAPLNLPQTRTHEFRQLITFLEKLLHKARKDYRALKEFSENASHEIQTPLAVARGKLELLLESTDIQAQESALIQEAQHALQKISKLSRALTLLTKIENLEFEAHEEIDLSALCKAQVEEFEELCRMKNLRLEMHIQPGVRLKMDRGLAEILLGNLFKNAIQHNQPGGWIKIELEPVSLVVRNSGPAPKRRPEELFERFRKGNAGSGSLGLGLSIVRKICEVHNFEVNYQYTPKNHCVRVKFVNHLLRET